MTISALSDASARMGTIDNSEKSVFHQKQKIKKKQTYESDTFIINSSFFKFSQYHSRCTNPLQVPAAPILALFCLSIFIKVTIILAPEQPNGCPNETAPP